jgi:hypothetical protein
MIASARILVKSPSFMETSGSGNATVSVSSEPTKRRSLGRILTIPCTAITAECHSPTKQAQPVSPGNIGTTPFIGRSLKIASSKIPIAKRPGIPAEKSLIVKI